MSYQKEIIEELMENDSTFAMIDTQLKKLGIPLEISKIIFEYYNGSCDKCKECCILCNYMCSVQCLRNESVDVCCRYEMNNLLNKYEKKPLSIVIETPPDSD